MSDVEQGSVTLRERTRNAVRRQIADVALVMFDEQGFEQTTVDQIAVAVGISARSFFRYFACKEDIVVGDPMLFGEPLRQRLTQSLGSMPVWDALRDAFEVFLDFMEADADRSLMSTRVIIGSPALRARNTEKHLAWVTVMGPLLAGALTGPQPLRQYHARAVALAALTCLDVSAAELVQRGGTTSSRALLDEAFMILKPAVLTE